jgi:hypothetical protein
MLSSSPNLLKNLQPWEEIIGHPEQFDINNEYIQITLINKISTSIQLPRERIELSDNIQNILKAKKLGLLRTDTGFRLRAIE